MNSNPMDLLHGLAWRHLVQSGCIALTFFLAIRPCQAQTPMVFQQPEFSGIYIKAENINDIAISTVINTQNGPTRVIFYSEAVRLHVGEGMFSFMMAHELGHHKLNHVLMTSIPADPNTAIIRGRAFEDAADVFATNYWMERDPNIVEMGIQGMESPITGNIGSMVHRPTPARAQIIRTTRDKWIRDHSGASSGGPGTPNDNLTPDKDRVFSWFIGKSSNGFSELRGEAINDHFLGPIWNSKTNFPDAKHTYVDRTTKELVAAFNFSTPSDSIEFFGKLSSSIKSDLGNDGAYNLVRNTSNASTLLITNSKNDCKIRISRIGRMITIRFTR